MSLRPDWLQIDMELNPQNYPSGSVSQWHLDYEAVMTRLGATSNQQRKMAHPTAYAEAQRLQAARRASERATIATGCNRNILDEAA